MKIFERIVDQHLRGIVSVTENQWGFVKGCGTVDAIHAVKLLTEKHREKTKSFYLAFLDLEKALDRAKELVWQYLKAHDVPESYVHGT